MLKMKVLNPEIRINSDISHPYKWSKSTCQTKIHLPENPYFSYFSKKMYVVVTHQGASELMHTHNIHKYVFLEK